MPWYAWTIIVVSVLNALALVTMIDRPRDPLTPGTAVLNLIVTALFAWAIVELAAR